MTTGTYSDGGKVEVIGFSGGFAYITFLEGPCKGVSTKVPEGWVSVPQLYDILDEWGRVFWKNMPLEIAEANARRLEPYFGAWTVEETSGADHGEKPLR